MADRNDSQPGFVDIGGRRIFVQLRGNGPVVVMEGGGGRAGVGHADDVANRIARFATIITYDRAGLGRSDPPPAAPTAASMAEDLRALMNALGITEPVFLVGASLSGLIVQLFACCHPERVRGLVLLDPTPMETFETMPPGFVMPQFFMDAKGEKQPMPDGMRLETERMRQSCDQLQAAVGAGQMPDVPCIVITAALRGDGPMASHAQALLLRRHKTLIGRFARGQLVVAGNSDHTTILANDSVLVIDAVRNVLSMT